MCVYVVVTEVSRSAERRHSLGGSKPDRTHVSHPPIPIPSGVCEMSQSVNYPINTAPATTGGRVSWESSGANSGDKTSASSTPVAIPTLARNISKSADSKGKSYIADNEYFKGGAPALTKSGRPPQYVCTTITFIFSFSLI